MQYKTIVHELLQQRTQLHEQLRSTRRLLPTLETCAKELKASHEAWKNRLLEVNPDSDPSQIVSEALEMAIKELEDRLPSGLTADEDEPLSLDKAMAHVRNRTSRD
jgi:chromosome segregation ATPase